MRTISICQNHFIAQDINMRIIALLKEKGVTFFLNQVFRKLSFFREVFPELKFCSNISQHVNVVNLGSTAALHNFAYPSIAKIRYDNWALPVQSLYYDWAILSQYGSFLEENATIVLPLCPFDACTTDKTSELIRKRYNTFLHPVIIPCSDNLDRSKYLRFNEHPIFYIKEVYGTKKMLFKICLERPLSWAVRHIKGDYIHKDAISRIHDWKKQFDTVDLNAPLSNECSKSMQFNQIIMKKICDFCKNHDFNLGVVLLPVSQSLRSQFPSNFQENYITPLLEIVKNEGFAIMDYWETNKFAEDANFRDAINLKREYAEAFTKEIITKL